MELNLCLHVQSAEISGVNIDASLLVKASVCGVTKETDRLPVSKPVWNQELNFEVSHVLGDLWIELYSSSFMRLRLLGHTSIPLYDVRFSNKQLKGDWYELVLQQDTPEIQRTPHALSLDVHFELPRNIPPKDLAHLEKKLNEMQKILQSEMKCMCRQRNRLDSKQLDYPDTSPGVFQYPDEVKKKPVSHPLLEKKKTKSVSFDDTDDPERKKKFNAKEKWRAALLKPEFQKMRAQSSIIGGSKDNTTSRTRASSLAKLVTHIQGLKKIEDIVGNDDDVASFSEIIAYKRIRNRQRSREQFHVVKDTIDEDFRIHVYKKALQAMIYPASSLHAHQFVEKTYKSFTYCGECEGFIWGLAKQGVQCQRCGKNSHKKCAVSAKHDCFHIRDSNSSVLESHLLAVTEIMHDTVVKEERKFELLRNAFCITPEENTTIVDEVTKSIRDLARNFSATVNIRVMAAQGLAFNEGSEAKRLYVSVDVGGEKKRTKAFKESHHSPQWNEDIQFECHNYLEPIKIRVWNERNTTMSKLTHKMTSEGDHFLGQKIIEVLRLGAPSSLWYKLEKRTPDNIVSGSIQLTVSSTIAGEFLIAPYHVMYSLLHEQLFLHTHIRKQENLVICSSMDDKTCFLPGEAQDIIDEFAMRFAVEYIYRSLVHFKLILEHGSSLPNAFKAMNNLLVNVKEHMFHLSAEENAVRAVGLHVLMMELFEASNFGKDKIADLLEKLHGLLIVNLQNYREVYPVTSKEKLQQLSNTCQLLKTVAEFQMQAVGMEAKVTVSKLSTSIGEAMKECVRTTFDDIVQDLIPEGYSGHPGLNKSASPYEFYYNMIKQMISAVVEDKTVYQPYIKQYVNFDLEAMSMCEFWNQFQVTIQDLFKVDDNLNVFPPIEAIHLLLTVKKLYEERVRKFQKDVTAAEYPFWFEPAVKYWIQDFQQSAMNFVNNSWEHDKGEQFVAESGQTFSSSAYDMFVYFQKGQEVIQGLDAGQVELRYVYLYEYAKVIRSLIVHYIDLVSIEIPNCGPNLNLTLMLLNNLQFVRYGVQDIFEAMGGTDDAGPSATVELQELQTTLTKQLNTWCPYVVTTQKESIWSHMKAMQEELIKLRAQGSATRDDAKPLVEPVLDALFARAKTIGETCKKGSVLPKLIKELWYVVMEGLQNMLLPNVLAVSGTTDNIFHPINYHTRHCMFLDHIIDQLKDFFMDDNVGVKEFTLDRNVKQMKAITKLFRQPTEYLIGESLKSSRFNSADELEAFGEIGLEMNIARRPASGGMDGTLRVISANDIQPHQHHQISTGYKFFIDFNFIFPNCQQFSNHRYRTTSVTASEVNQTFKFTLPPTDLCELQATVKHKPLMGAKEQILGVATVPFEVIMKSRLYTMNLYSSLPHNEKGRAFLTILALRSSDEIARDFVILRTCHRSAERTKETA